MGLLAFEEDDDRWGVHGWFVVVVFCRRFLVRLVVVGFGCLLVSRSVLCYCLVVVGVLVWFWFGLVLGWFGVSYVRWFGFGFGLVCLVGQKGKCETSCYSSLMDLSARVLSTGYVHLFGISTGYILHSWSLSIQEAINYLEEQWDL